MLGHKVKVFITGCSHRGEGLGRLPSGQIIFIPYALPGEEVECQVTEVKRDYARGRLEKIVAPSPHRIEPACPVFYTCGGCHLQHAAYPLQLEIKRRQVEEALLRLGKLQGYTLKPVLGMDWPWRYRNKVHLHVGKINETLRLGLYQERSHELVDTRDCLLLPEDMVKIWQILEEEGIPHIQEKGLYGALLRKSFSTGEIMVGLVGYQDLCPEGRLFQNLLNYGASSIVQILPGNGLKVLAGQKYLWEEIGPCRFRLSPTSFFQVNPRQAAKIYEIVLDYASLTGKETVIDIYSGTGTIALFLAPRASKVYGLEVSEEALADARANAQENKAKNVSFLWGPAERSLPRLLEKGTKAEVIVLDPPRQGCHPRVLETVARSRPRRLIYVSCYPATLARDLQYLSCQGYWIKEVQPVDMFPQTHHIECVALLLPKDNRKSK